MRCPHTMSSRHGRLALAAASSSTSSSSQLSESLLRIYRPLVDFLTPSLALATVHTQPPRWRRLHFRNAQGLRRYVSSTPTTHEGANAAFGPDKHADAVDAATSAAADRRDAAQERPGGAKRRTPLSGKHQQFLDRAVCIRSSLLSQSLFQAKISYFFTFFLIKTLS